MARHSSPSGNRYRASDSGRISALYPGRVGTTYARRGSDRIEEVLVQVVDVLDHPAVEEPLIAM